MNSATSQETELHAALRPWVNQAAGMIERRLSDARQYAAAGSLATAHARLSELAVSLKRHISDARAHYYRAAFAQHTRAGLDPAVHQLGLGPTAEGEAAARRAGIMGRDYAFDVVDIVSDAQASLVSATLAGGDQYLDAWSAENGRRLSSRARTELSDSQISIFHAVGQIFIKPELR